MFRIATLALLAVGMTAGLAQAQFIIVESRPRVVYSSPVVTYSPSVSYYAPTVAYSSPVVTYSSPIVASPVVSYSYYPATTVYSAPAVVPVTTRSYYGYGIFRPRGVYYETYIGR